MKNAWVCFSFCFGASILIGFLPGSLAQLSPSESTILLQLQEYLEYPDALKSWNKWTNFCYLPSSSSVTVVCSNGHVTELTVIGNRTSHFSNPLASGKFAISQQTLSQKFSIDSVFTALTKLSSLQKLTLVSLGIWGPLTSKITHLQSLELLNISSNFIYGEIPPTFSSLKSLKSFVLADNLINGTVPDLSSIKGLQELDLSNNQIGPDFPSLAPGLVSIILRNNSLRSQIPPQIKKFNQLQRFDASSNRLVGTLPPFVLSLPALWYLNLADNGLTGELPKSTTCGLRLWFVDISRNLLVGSLPSCIGSGSNKYRKVLSVWNCLAGSKFQHPASFCQRQALAVIPPAKKTEGDQQDSGFTIGLIFGVIGGTVLLVGTVGLLLWMILKRRSEDTQSYTSFGGKMPAGPSPIVDPKYVARSMRMPTLGLLPYHDFTLGELEEATNNFDPVNLVGERSQGQVTPFAKLPKTSCFVHNTISPNRETKPQFMQVYRGLLQSGSAVLIKCIKVKEKHSPKALKQHMEVISQLRHQNLVSILGHCVVTYQERQKNSTIFIVFEHVTNGSLREHMTDWRRKERLKWPQRMTMSMGIARGVQFLHTGMAAGVIGNDLKVENILLDESLTPKISNYRIPLLFKADTLNGQSASSSANPEKEDIYNLGVILLELLTGKLITSESQLDELKLELERGLSESASALQLVVDLSMRGTFAYQSIKTATEITLSCLCKDPGRRPPMEDVVWHLQYSMQAQQAWTTSGNLALNSGNLGLHK
ncbi:hypothetical protein Cgig2_031258 [Carnegiea gigantea]|uniref:non-specific serine/threonine protein kinase n=1 Tax=Carnegiea gigantea TaxID=171969 RepID=A0A9Q1KKT9_9CARY|nr:hypothetical protein Cgig2_031258 [Carnegiea gigantea]